jgi:cytochrome c553
VEDDLLVMDKTDLCLFCHGSGGAGLAQTNVDGGVLRNSSDVTTGALRGGGFSDTLMNTADNGYGAGYPTTTAEWTYPVSLASSTAATSEHTLGTEATIWGSWNAAGVSDAVENAGDTNTTLECVSCHDPHAFGQTYRMLTRRPEGAGVGKHPTPDDDPWEQRVFVTDQLAYSEAYGSAILSYTTSDYTDVGYAFPDVVRVSGAHGGAADAAVLSDGTADFIHDNVKINDKVLNVDDGSEAVITAVTATTITGALSGGTDDDWDTGDEYIVIQQVVSRGSAMNAYSQQLGEWCASCHDRYHAQKTDFAGIGTTDSGDLIFAYQHKTGDATPAWDGEYLGNGTHVGADDATVLLDTGADFSGVEVGDIVVNSTDGSEGTITAVDDGADTIEASLHQGAENDWDTGDDYFLYDAIDGEWKSDSCGYACHDSQGDALSCVSCHVAHGTSAQMTAIIQAMPWPGEGGNHYDGMPGGGGLPQDIRAEFTGGTDHDAEDRSNLLRLDNRGVCQNPSCHPKGKDNYTEAYDDH